MGGGVAVGKCKWLQPCNKSTRLSVQHKETWLEMPETHSRPSAGNKGASDARVKAYTPNSQDALTEL